MKARLLAASIFKPNPTKLEDEGEQAREARSGKTERHLLTDLELACQGEECLAAMRSGFWGVGMHAVGLSAERTRPFGARLESLRRACSLHGTFLDSTGMLLLLPFRLGWCSLRRRACPSEG